jgi:SEC-C motif
MKVGRNEKCPCGSGRKYKKCCLDLHRGPQLVFDRDENGLLTGRPEIQTVHPGTGQRFVATGSGVSWIPGVQTRHEFYIGNLRRLLGQDWHEAQQALPEQDRHPVECWNRQFEDLKAGKIAGAAVERDSATRFSAPMTGDVLSLLCVGHDA